MTKTAERAGKSVRTVRMSDDTWNLMQSRRGMTASTLINDMTEAGLGFARCYRCAEAVPVGFGDLTGKPLAEWVAEAGKTVTAQHRTGHRPVTIGNAAPSRPEVSPGTVTFLEPGGKPVTAAPVPAVPAADRNKKRMKGHGQGAASGAGRR